MVSVGGKLRDSLMMGTHGTVKQGGDTQALTVGRSATAVKV